MSGNNSSSSSDSEEKPQVRINPQDKPVINYPVGNFYIPPPPERRNRPLPPDINRKNASGDPTLSVHSKNDTYLDHPNATSPPEVFEVSSSGSFQCSKCGYKGDALYKRKPKGTAWVCFIALLILFLPIACLPFFMDSCYEQKKVCPKH